MKRTLEAELKLWKSREEHLPILLRGARQVGKSYLIEQFGKESFEDLAVADFENRPELKNAFSSREPKEIVTRLEFALRKPIRPKKAQHHGKRKGDHSVFAGRGGLRVDGHVGLSVYLVVLVV